MQTVGHGPIYRSMPLVGHCRAQELCESRGGRPGLPSLISLMVSVDVKQHSTTVGHNDAESRRGQKEGGELDSQEEASPEEIKNREVVLG